MPDLLTHTISGYLVMRPAWRRFFLPSIFLVGCIYPDLIRGPSLVLTSLAEFDMPWSIRILHSPAPLLIQTWLVSLLFEAEIRKKVFCNLLAGISLHLLLDGCQKAYELSYLWLFPFSFNNPISGIWWADDDLWLTLTMVVLGLGIFFYRRTNGSPTSSWGQ